MHHAIPLILLSAFLLGGCGSAPKVTSMERVEQLYAEGLDGAATRAADILVRTRAPGRAEAAWYGGLAAYREGNDSQARSLFKTAATSRTQQIAGGAEAMLGQLSTRRFDYAEALQHFERAWLLLRGTDQRQATLRGVAAARCSGNSQALARWEGRLKSAESAAPSTDSDEAWVLQAGAYRNRTAADTHAARLRPRATRAGVGAVTVRSRRDSGGIWWLVQCGGFASRTEASAARRSLNSDDLIVARRTP